MLDDPPTDADLDRIESMIESQSPDHLVLVRDIGPLVRRLVAEVRRLTAERQQLLDRVRNLES